MKVLFIYRHPDLGYSIGKVFRPIEKEMRKLADVDALYLPVPSYSIKALCENIRYAQRVAKTKQYDVIHITGAEHYLLPFLRGHKTVVTVHDLGHYFNLHGLRKWKFGIMQVHSLGCANVIVPISNYTLYEIEKARLFKKRRMQVIPDQVGNEFQYTEKTFNVDNPVILHIGTRPHKNLTRTIEALEGIQCHLRIVGKVENSDAKLMNEKNIEYSIGQNLSDEELLQEYKNADIINFPSLHEGFGMPIIEGQAIGRLVITSNIEPMVSVAGKNGAILCNPYEISSIREAYKKAITESTYRKNIIKAGLENVKQYRLEHITKQYFELYKSL